MKEIGDFDAIGNDKMALPRRCRRDMLACVVPGGREYWR